MHTSQRCTRCCSSKLCVIHAPQARFAAERAGHAAVVARRKPTYRSNY